MVRTQKQLKPKASFNGADGLIQKERNRGSPKRKKTVKTEINNLKIKQVEHRAGGQVSQADEPTRSKEKSQANIHREWLTDGTHVKRETDKERK